MERVSKSKPVPLPTTKTHKHANNNNDCQRKLFLPLLFFKLRGSFRTYKNVHFYCIPFFQLSHQPSDSSGCCGGGLHATALWQRFNRSIRPLAGWVWRGSILSRLVCEPQSCPTLLGRETFRNNVHVPVPPPGFAAVAPFINQSGGPPAAADSENTSCGLPEVLNKLVTINM